METSSTLGSIRQRIRDHYLLSEETLTPRLIDAVELDDATRDLAQAQAAKFVHAARAGAVRSGLIDKFLQEYGLSTAEGVTLMRLAEALLRTPDAATADALIEDKIEAGNWAAHKGKSPFPLVNFSTRALMLTAAWLDDIEAKDPLRKMAAATKSALDRLGEPVIRASVAQAMRIMGEHFVLGETIDSAMKRAKRFAEKGYVFSFDMLGEAAHTAKDADKYYRDYENAIAAIAKHSIRERAAENPGISVKLSALHPRYEYAKKERVLKELGERVRTLALQAKAANIGFNIDAEEADRLDLSLDIIELLMRDPELANWTGFGVVVQAYQRRASDVLDWLAALSRETERRIMVRLVKGAYWDSEIKRAQVMGLETYPVFTRKVLTDLSYIACARKLFNNSDVFYPQFATHNALTATMVQAMAGEFKDFELQRLHGMGEALHDSLIESGARSRIYAPVGGHKELLPYLVRRLLENGANSSFVNQLIDPDLSVDDVVADPLEEVAELTQYANPSIPAPRDCLNGERLSARGHDETHPPTAQGFSPDARSVIGDLVAKPIINGETRNGQSNNVINPADHGDVIGCVEHASETDVAAACVAASEFAPSWANTPVADRANTLRHAADLLETRDYKFMALAVFEAGKSWPDAIAEIREAVDFLRYYADEAEKLTASPLGVVACISPWNFPLAIFLGQVSAALAAGNCVIAKPAEQTPLIAFEAIKLLHEAGIPGGALQYLPGDGPSVGGPLVAHQVINGVIFTGSTEVAQLIKRSMIAAKKHDATLIAETGGINAMIVDSTALLEQAVHDTVSSAFQSAGQRCSACRVVCVQDDIADRFIEMLEGSMTELHLGNPSSLATDVGPVIDEEAKANIAKHIQRLDQIGKKVAQISNHHEGGTFVAPVAYELNSIRDVTQEIFGPVLHVIRYRADELDKLIDDINGLGFGLTMGIHTRIDETMEEISRRARVGNLYVNRNQIGAVVGVQPFGGEGLSGTGPKAGGPHYLPALVNRPRPDGDGRAPISEGDTSTQEDAALTAASLSYRAWNTADRASFVKAIIQNLNDPDATSISKMIDQLELNVELPGPTGESNTLKNRGRGVALCLGGDHHLKQVLMALAFGNTVVTVDGDAAQKIRNACEQAGMPAGVISIIDNGVSSGLLKDDRLRVIVFDGGTSARSEIEHLLAERKSSIIPLVSTLDAPWRFMTERTLTINTTAAGGDVRLLSLSE